MQTPDTSTKARAAAVAIEDMIRHSPVETGVFIAPDGSTVLKRKGHSNRVGFTLAELRQAAGMTFTHNHPSGYGPSLDDVRLGLAYGMREVRVVTPRHRYGASTLNGAHLVPIERAFPVEEARALVFVGDKVRLGAIHPSDFGPEVRHRTWLTVSTQIGFDYWRQPS